MVAGARIWSRSVLAVGGAKIHIEGFERIPDEPRICFVGNHQGDMDILLLLAVMKRSIGFVAKRQALYVPMLNLWVAILGGVFIDRKNPRKAMAELDRGTKHIKQGMAMAVFPEGTRSRGPTMGSFKPGSLKLAIKANAILVPITINGTYKMWEAEKRIQPAVFSLIVHEPIKTEGMKLDEKKLLPERIKEIIASGLPH